jgi:hypothetical protein
MAKITSIQQPTGNQYLKKIVYFSTPDKYRNFDARQPESPGKKMHAANFSLRRRRNAPGILSF